MEGSSFIVRHVDVSVAAPETVWRWRGWASTDERHPLRDHRTLDVYRDGSMECERIVDFHEPLSAGLMESLGKLEWAVADIIASVHTAARPALGGLRSARRGTFKPAARRTPRIVDGAVERQRRRPAQPMRCNRVLVDITNVWDGATVRLVVTRQRVELQMRSTSGLELGDLPSQVHRALRHAGDCIRETLGEELDRIAHAISRGIPSYALAREIEADHDERFEYVDRSLPGAPTAWERDVQAMLAGSPDPGPPLRS